ncbi:GtrA family protein [Sphingomonas gei]|uniref:GtrA family protein n=2 Tax=Sphingomonas gei TaxID=1395960 RepID=A0A4S1X4U0_9SPHN|nr:GtrA family protein [Sphingomonas gei]
MPGIGGRPLRFLIAGGVNTLVGLTFYPLLLWAMPPMRTHYLVALGIAQITCLLFAFTTYKYGVFRTRGNVVREFGTFSGFYLVNYAANWAVLPLLVEIVGVHPSVVQTGFTLIVIATSWLWHSRVTFRAAERAA